MWTAGSGGVRGVRERLRLGVRAGGLGKEARPNVLEVEQQAGRAHLWVRRCVRAGGEGCVAGAETEC